MERRRMKKLLVNVVAQVTHGPEPDAAGESDKEPQVNTESEGKQPEQPRRRR
ncbi:hypothetical protein [Actinoallomurus sp. NPDC052274]|uniref:hypothetical protein n=1 Tax=Actinoallomurus sp. NPDC052274 TaxID=3155420 RepID=UPI0034372F09